MLKILEKLQPNGTRDNSLQKKILCIIEGDLEFRYIVKIFKLFGYEKGCYPLSNELIKVAWGKTITPSQNIIQLNCRFQGGSLKGRKVPFPAIDAFELYEDDLTVFDSIIVFFDGDKDKNNEVENYFINRFSTLNIKNSLLVSIPCFESTLIDFCSCGACREMIEDIDNEKYPCDKYKKNFSMLNCFNGIKNLIISLNIGTINNLKESKLLHVNQIINNFMNSYFKGISK